MKERIITCFYCHGAGCSQANGEPCTECAETGRLRVLVLGPATR